MGTHHARQHVAVPVILTHEVVHTGDVPVTGTATVVSVERRDESGVVGLDVQLDMLFSGGNKPHTYFLSRLVDEPRWFQDAHFRADGVPHFSHGFGTRYPNTRGIHLALATLLDEAARTRDLVLEIGPDVPLTLAPAPSAASSNAAARETGKAREPM